MSIPGWTIEEIINLAQEDSTDGICIYCGSIQGGVEPDAEKYKCEGCGALGVYGAEQIILLELF